MRVAIDAANLARDRRGMGRIARAVLRLARADSRTRVVLLASRADAATLRAEVPDVAIASPASARARDRYDVVWFPFNGMRYPTAAPALVTVHDAFAFTEPHAEFVARFREQRPIRRAARRAALVATDSRWSRAEIARELRLPFARIAVVRPEPDAFWSPGVAGPLPAPLAARRFALIVGAREPRKNAALAVEACARAFRAADETLVVVGELPANVRARARALGLRCGEIAASDETLRSLYRSARVVLVPSTAEGFGLVAVEALACGAALLASDASALPEATDGAAPLLDPHDADAWARAIRDVFDDDERADALRAIARERFAARDRDAGARETLRLLYELAAR